MRSVYSIHVDRWLQHKQLTYTSVTMEYDMTGVDLTLSGHTHGGKMTLCYLWTPAMPGVILISH